MADETKAETAAAGGGKVLDRGAIFAADDLPVERVEVPEWGGAVYVRTMTGTEVDEFDAWLSGRGKARHERPSDRAARGRLAALVLCDERGRRLFSDDDAAMLGDKSGRALDRVCLAGRKLSGMNAEDLEAAKGN